MSISENPIAIDAQSLVSEAYALLLKCCSESGADPVILAEVRRVLNKVEADENPSVSATMLPLVACAATGGNPRNALPVGAAFQALTISSKLLDDVVDGDVQRVGAPDAIPRAINTAMAFWGTALLALWRLPEPVYLEVAPNFDKGVVCVAGAQQREFALYDRQSLEVALETAIQKLGWGFQIAACSGARCGTSERRVIDAIGEWGLCCGVIIQLLDDTEGFWEAGAGGDLALSGSRRKLPVLYALAVATPEERVRLEDLLDNVNDDAGAEKAARQLMADMGASDYMLAEIANYRRRARRALDAVGLEQDGRAMLDGWLAALQPALLGDCDE